MYSVCFVLHVSKCFSITSGFEAIHILAAFVTTSLPWVALCHYTSNRGAPLLPEVAAGPRLNIVPVKVLSAAKRRSENVRKLCHRGSCVY